MTFDFVVLLEQIILGREQLSYKKQLSVLLEQLLSNDIKCDGELLSNFLRHYGQIFGKSSPFIIVFLHKTKTKMRR